MITKTIVIDIDADEANKSLEQVTENVDELSDSVEDVGKETEQSAKATKKLSTGLKGVGTALKALGIGFIIAAFTKLFEILGKNQKVIDIFNTAMTGLEMVFKDVWDFVANNFMPTFDNVQNFFKNFSFQNIINGAKSVLGFFGKLSEAALAFFKGNFKEAKALAGEAFEPIVDVVNRTTEALVSGFKSMGNYAKETFSAARAMTELNNQALLAESINRGLIEQYDRQAEQLRQIRDDDVMGLEERIAANEKLGDVLNEQEKLMLGNAGLTIRAAQNQLALNNNIENQIALQDALNERAAIQAQIEGFRSEQLINTNSLLRERAELETAYYDEIDAMMQADSDEYDKAQNKKIDDSIKYSDEKIELAKGVNGAEVQLATQTTALISQIAGENSIAAKGVAVAQATMNTYQGVTAALAQTTDPTPGQFLRFANAAAVGVMGLLNVAKIAATNPTSGSAVGSTVSTPTTPTAPSFNLVSGTGTNQIADSINKEMAPTKAYVVSSDVSTSQELDRKIIAGASL